MRATDQAVSPATWVAVAASVVGFGGIALLWSMSSNPHPVILLLCAAPFLLGLVAALGTMDMRYRVLALWIAAGLSGLLAALSIISGVGLVFLAAMIAYLWAGWRLNEAAG